MTSPWSTSTVGEQFEVQLGKMLDAAKNAGVSKPYLGNRAVQWGRIDLSAVSTVPLTSSDIRRFRLQHGDLLVCEGGEVGRGAIWRDELPECYYQKALHRLRPRRGYDSRLMLAFLEYWSSVGGFTNYVTQTSIAHLPRDKFIQMPLPLPTPAEQHRISDTLDDVKNLLSHLERLIAKKQAIKRGMMQQLLTGRSRLPGFTEQWLRIPIGELYEQHRHTIDPRQYRSRRFQHFSLPAFDDGENPGNDLGSSIDSIKFLVPAEAVLVSKLNPRIPRIWAPDHVGSNAVASTEFVVVTSKQGTNRSYLKWLLKSNSVITRMKLLATGTTGSHARIHPRHIAAIEVVVPKESEQIAIASVLDDIEEEVRILRIRLDKAKAVKKGVMQQLLTGRTRLPVEAAS
ncbi:restriction endonuclease subunit S [Rhodococcus ruber]|uniref:restriction endonuclease subunit S n=1 Tax=Rhodococcus ruber TaxID=1830 RepID=UPI003783A35D